MISLAAKTTLAFILFRVNGTPMNSLAAETTLTFILFRVNGNWGVGWGGEGDTCAATAIAH